MLRSMVFPWAIRGTSVRFSYGLLPMGLSSYFHGASVWELGFGGSLMALPWFRVATVGLPWEFDGILLKSKRQNA